MTENLSLFRTHHSHPRVNILSVHAAVWQASDKFSLDHRLHNAIKCGTMCNLLNIQKKPILFITIYSCTTVDFTVSHMIYDYLGK